MDDILKNPNFEFKMIGPNSWIALYVNYQPPTCINEFNEIWQQHPIKFNIIKMFGKDVEIPRYQQAYGKSYSYSGTTSEAVEPTPFILNIQDQLNLLFTTTKYKFNMCLCNWYEGHHYIGPHSDDTRQLVTDSPIASLSWGGTRTFVLKPKATFQGMLNHSLECLSIDLHSGDLIIMGGKCQSTHTHEILKLKKKEQNNNNRINFTFRCFHEA